MTDDAKRFKPGSNPVPIDIRIEHWHLPLA